VLARAADAESVIRAQPAEPAASGAFAAADLDLARQDEVREQLPSLRNRQPAAYRWPAEVRA
jgi:hypothetical protein